MRRYLAEHGTSFRKLLDEVRADLSKNYLMHSQMSIDQIAYVLGYTETTNFRRAFKGWLGVSPTEFRRNPVH
jgi:AraC-like DNA-binding protein